MSERESFKSVSRVYENLTGRLILSLLFLEVFALSMGMQVGRTAFDLDKISLYLDNLTGIYGLVNAAAWCAFVASALKLWPGRVMGSILVIGSGFLRGLQLSAIFLCSMPCRLWLLPVLLISELALFAAIAISSVAKEQKALSVRRKGLSVDLRRMALWLLVILLDGMLVPFIVNISA